MDSVFVSSALYSVNAAAADGCAAVCTPVRLGRMTQKANGKWEWERVPQTWVCYPYRGANRTTKLDAWQLLTLFSVF